MDVITLYIQSVLAFIALVFLIRALFVLKKLGASKSTGLLFYALLIFIVLSLLSGALSAVRSEALSFVVDISYVLFTVSQMLLCIALYRFLADLLHSRSRRS